MLASLLALSGAPIAGPAPCEYIQLQDPVLDPPEVIEGDSIIGGVIRVQTEDGGAALLLEHGSVLAKVHAVQARVTLLRWFYDPSLEPGAVTSAQERRASWGPSPAPPSSSDPSPRTPPSRSSRATSTRSATATRRRRRRRPVLFVPVLRRAVSDL